MNKISFFNLTTLLLFKHRSRHLAIFLISTLLIFLLSAVLLVTTSIRTSTEAKLQHSSDFIVQKLHAGHPVDVIGEWLKSIASIRGVSALKGRIWGAYRLDNRYSVNILGVDLTDAQTKQNLQHDLPTLNLKTFIGKDQMIISPSFAHYLHQHFFDKSFDFFTPKGEKIEVAIYQTIDETSPLYNSDLAIIPIDLARKILGIDAQHFSDITLNVPNDSERDTVLEKLQSLFFDARIIDKRDLFSAYESFFHFKSAIFLILFSLLLLTFMLILYQRFNLAGSSEKQEVATMRMLGWSVNQILILKLTESIIIAFVAFALGFLLAYLYVFGFNAPLLGDLFLGFTNLPKPYHFTPHIEATLILSIFLLFMISFTLSLLIPIWRIAITDPSEALK